MDALALSAIEALTAQMARLNANLERQYAQKDYLTADDAAPLVGLAIVASGNHRNRLTRAYKSGLLPNTIVGRPYHFSRKDLLNLSARIAQGEVSI